MTKLGSATHVAAWSLVFAAACSGASGPALVAPASPPEAPTAPASSTPEPSTDTPSSPDGGSSADAPASGLPPRPALGTKVGGGCTEMGCANGVSVRFQPDAGWPAGRYAIEIEADGAVQRCEVTLPLRACDAGPSTKCTGATVATIGESGCALPRAQHGLSGIDLTATPSRLRVRVDRDGKQITSLDATPKYRWIQPNGRGCGPQCLAAKDQLTLKL